MSIIYNKKSTLLKRIDLRNNTTLMEKKLWAYLRRDKLGVRFRRQFGIGEYIVDFYAPIIKLVVEVDGNQHYTKEGLEYDKVRSEYLEAVGETILRFKNQEIKNEIEKVIDVIKNKVEELS